MKVKLATKRIGALALSLLIGLGSCVTTNIQKAYATDELESQASDSISSATTSGGDAVTLADALGDEDEDTGIAPLSLGDQYTVTFNLNGGTLDPVNITTDNQQVTVEEGQTVANPGYPVKYESNGMGDYINMYKLDKWTLDGEEYDFSTPVTSNIELTATYSQMYITFDGNGGLLTNVAGAFGPFTDQASVTKKMYKDVLVTLFFTRGTREGFTFDGFDEKPDGTGTAEIPYSGDLPMLGKYLSDINYTSVGGDVTFYAKWVQAPKHKVTFHLDGGTLDYSESTPSENIVVEVADGETVAKPAVNPILYSDNGSGSGYRYSRLEKWTLNDNEYDFSTPVTSDLELDANYTPINVTLHGNGGLITSDDVIYQCGSQNFYDVEEVTLILNDLVQHQMSQVSGTRTGYKMQTSEYGKVWTQNADGSGVTMRYLTADESAGHTVKSTFGEYLEQIGYTDGDIDLYAQWVDLSTVTHKVTFDLDGGTTDYENKVGQNIVVEVADGQTVAKPTTPIRYVALTQADGPYDKVQRLNKWKLGNDEFDFSTPITSDITIKATYVDMWVTLDGNGGSIACTDESYWHGSNTFYFASKTSLYFSELVQKQLGAIEGGRDGDGNNYKLLADWSQNPDGSGARISATEPSLGAYLKAINWDGGNITIYAQWKQYYKRIYYVGNDTDSYRGMENGYFRLPDGVSVYDEREYFLDDEVVIPQNPVDPSGEGKYFVGWTDDLIVRNTPETVQGWSYTIVDPASITDNKNHSFYAIWGYKATFDPNNGEPVETQIIQHTSTNTYDCNFVYKEPVKAGYKFLGWVPVSKYDNLLAREVTYTKTGDSFNITEFVTCSYGEALESGRYNDINYVSNVAFICSSNDPNSGGMLTPDAPRNDNFIAVWQKVHYSLRYQVAGHKDCESCDRLGINNASAGKYVVYGETIEDPQVLKSNVLDFYDANYGYNTDYGYIDGWYTSKDFTPESKIDFTEKIEDIARVASTDGYLVTIYGKFVSYEIPLYINPNNGGNDVNTIYKLGDWKIGHSLSESGMTLPTVTRNGSNFQGWRLFAHTDEEVKAPVNYGFATHGDGQNYGKKCLSDPQNPMYELRNNGFDREYCVFSKIKDLKQLVYIACWDFKIKIDYDNDTDATEDYVTKFNEVTPKLKVPTKEGYTFLGWITRIDDNGRYKFLCSKDEFNRLYGMIRNYFEYYERDGYTYEEAYEKIEKTMGVDNEYIRIGMSTMAVDFDRETTLIKALWSSNGSDHRHTWFTTWSSDNDNHWHDAACGHDVKKDQAPHTPSDWIIDKQPTSSSEGLKHKECTVCGKVLETGKIAKIEIIIQPEATPTPSATPVPSATPTSEPKHEHEFSKEWTTNESSHWHEATCGHDVRDGEAPHTSSDWIVAKQPTETEEGYRYKECTVCYDVLETEIIDRLSSMVIEVPEDSDPQPVVEETVTEEPIETPAPVVTPAPATKEDKVIVAPVFDNGDQDAENIQGAMGRFLEGVKTVAVVLSISLAAVLGILGLLLLILAAMRRVKVQNDRSGDYEESNFVTVYKTSVSTEGSRIAQLFRKNDRVWNIVIPEEIVADRVTDFFKVVLTKSFCKRYNGEQLIVIMDSEDDQVKKQFGFVIDGEDNEVNITIKE